MAVLNISLHASYKGFAKFSETYHGTQQAEWDRLHDGNGNLANNVNIRAGEYEGVINNRSLKRGFLAFNTSVIGSGVITDVKIKLTGSEYRKNNTNDFYIGSGTQNATIVNSNYQGHVTTTNYATWLKQGSGSGSGTRNFSNVESSFNQAGKDAINKTGITKFSWRTIIDQTDSGYTYPDSYNWVDITSATLIITYNPSLTFEESFSMGEVLNRNISKTFEENISIGEDFEVVKNPNRKIFEESFSIGEDFDIRKGVTKIFKESIIIGENLKKYLNGHLISKWSKVNKTITNWVKTSRESINWTKKSKPENIWTKKRKK